MNKKASFQIWIEIVLFLILFLFIMGIIGSEMNTDYEEAHDLTLGLDLSQQLSELKNYTSDTINSTSEGQSSITDFGVLKLSTAPKLVWMATKILWNFFSGSFIYDLVSQMNIGIYGSYIAVIFQILFILAIAFLFLKLVLRMPV